MKRNNQKQQIKKRAFLLLEVLIAFALIALCAIPMIAPHISMIKAQKELETKMKINHAAKLIYANVLEKMHKNEIPLAQVEDGKTISVQEEFLEGITGYTADYRFKIIKSKNNDQGLHVYRAILEVHFIKLKKEEKLVFETPLFLCAKKNVDSSASVKNVDEEESEET